MFFNFSQYHRTQVIRSTKALLKALVLNTFTERAMVLVFAVAMILLISVLDKSKTELKAMRSGMLNTNVVQNRVNSAITEPVTPFVAHLFLRQGGTSS